MNNYLDISSISMDKGLCKFSMFCHWWKDDDGYFTLREETLKPKGWDLEENEC